MTNEQIEKNFNEFMANPHWKKYFDDAPQSVKEYIRTEFAMSADECFEQEEFVYAQKLSALEKRFTDADWDYIIGHCNNVQGKHMLQQARMIYSGR